MLREREIAWIVRCEYLHSVGLVTTCYRQALALLKSSNVWKDNTNVQQL